MHTASEFDSGLPAVDTYNRDMRNKKKKTKWLVRLIDFIMMSHSYL